MNNEIIYGTVMKSSGVGGGPEGANEPPKFLIS